MFVLPVLSLKNLDYGYNSCVLFGNSELEQGTRRSPEGLEVGDEGGSVCYSCEPRPIGRFDYPNFRSANLLLFIFLLNQIITSTSMYNSRQ